MSLNISNNVVLLKRRKAMIKESIKVIDNLINIELLDEVILKESLQRLEANLVLTMFAENKVSSAPGKVLLDRQELAKFYFDCNLLRLSLTELEAVVKAGESLKAKKSLDKMVKLKKELVRNRLVFYHSFRRALVIQERFNLDTSLFLEPETKNLKIFTQGLLSRFIKWSSTIFVIILNWFLKFIK